MHFSFKIHITFHNFNRKINCLVDFSQKITFFRQKSVFFSKKKSDFFGEIWKKEISKMQKKCDSFQGPMQNVTVVLFDT